MRVTEIVHRESTGSTCQRRSRRWLEAIVLSGAMLCGHSAFSQNGAQAGRLQSDNPDTPAQPLPPDIRDGQPSRSADATVSVQTSATSALQPDDHVLSSAETLGLGSLTRISHIFDPSLQFSQSAETGIVANRILAVSSLGGSLDLAKRWRRYRLAISYNGAETMYQPASIGLRYLPYHRLGISQEIVLARWTLRLRDDIQYAPSAGFGGLFTGGLPQIGQYGILDNLQPSFFPGGTIQTGTVKQIAGSALAEADYSLSHRTTLTLVGSDSLMRFFSAGYINSQDIHGRIGYNYALSAKNNLALTYDHDYMNFGGAGNIIQEDVAQLAFGRKLTGRLAFQVMAGPQLLHLHNFASSPNHQLSWAASTSLTYNVGHTRYSLMYSRGATSGSGVFIGSNTDTITAGLDHQLTKSWFSSLNGGYAINRNLSQSATFSNRFDNWYAGASLNRQIVRQVRLGISYEFEQQTGGNGSCPVLSCGLESSFNQLSVNLQWHMANPAR